MSCCGRRTARQAATAVHGDLLQGRGIEQLHRGREGATLDPSVDQPAREGPFVFRVKLPDGSRIPPHTHPKTERITVLSYTNPVRLSGSRLPTAGKTRSEDVRIGHNHWVCVSGTFHIGMGDKFEEKAAKAMSADTYGHWPAGMKHFVWAKGETILQFHRMGPWSIQYVNPEDDPRN